MNWYRQTISLVGLVACLSAIDATVKSARAGENTTTPKIATTELRPQSVSTSAADLFLEPNLTTDYRLAQNSLELEKFCQNYPFNSRCRDIPQNEKPDTGVDTIPVPSLPPAPPSPSQQPDSERRQRRSRNSKSGWAIAPEVSTQGLGGFVVRRINSRFNARVGINAFGLNDLEINSTDATYEADLNLFNVSTIIDAHPIKNFGLRLSGGLVFGNNSVEGTATPNDDLEIEIGDETFTVDQLASVDVDIDVTNSVSPYLGIGGGNPVAAGKGLGFWWNLGVVFGGSPDINLEPNIPEEFNDEDVRRQIDEEIEKETKKIEDDIDFINIYPVVSLGLSYQF